EKCLIGSTRNLALDSDRQAPSEPPHGEWNDDDFDVLADEAVANCLRKSPVWLGRTNIWRKETSPGRGTKRLRSECLHHRRAPMKWAISRVRDGRPPSSVERLTSNGRMPEELSIK